MQRKVRLQGYDFEECFDGVTRVRVSRVSVRTDTRVSSGLWVSSFDS